MTGNDCRDRCDRFESVHRAALSTFRYPLSDKPISRSANLTASSVLTPPAM